MGKNKRRQEGVIGNPNQWIFPWEREKSKTAQDDSSMSSRRVLIVVDNVIAAGLFGFFSVWINVYLGLEGYVEDFWSSVSMTINEIRLNFMEVLLYFLLYLFLLWRSPEKISPMPLNIYFKKYMPIVLVISLVMFFLVYMTCRRLMVERMGCADGNYPFIPSVLRWILLSTLFYYRRFFLPWIALFIQKGDAGKVPPKNSIWTDTDDETK